MTSLVGRQFCEDLRRQAQKFHDRREIDPGQLCLEVRYLSSRRVGDGNHPWEGIKNDKSSPQRGRAHALR